MDRIAFSNKDPSLDKGFKLGKSKKYIRSSTKENGSTNLQWLPHHSSRCSIGHSKCPATKHKSRGKSTSA
ncbi:hypothetical protein J6590_095522 [Homalodisca vitripennis]|nr:hypothetical protein J6590_099197 [Homalodisca vitripennis]KAG8324300.1 hypothetical protein J6590_095522 [Homalodisca vitripennis]